jgi:tetratricopeptide (TPR) repeat protein
LKLAPRTTTRDRLLITTEVGFTHSDPRAVAAGDSLASSFPNDPEALIRSAQVAADLSQAVRLLNRAIRLDSIAGHGPSALCRMCDALSQLFSRYAWADSLEAAERTARRWAALRPKDFMPWGLLADLMTSLGREADFADAMRRYEALGGSRANVHVGDFVHSLRSDDFATANRFCAEGLLSTDVEKYKQYRWYCTIGLRMQGRYREAYELVHHDKLPQSTIMRRSMPSDDLVHKAILDFEMGKPLAAVAQFRRAMTVGPDSQNVPDGIWARITSWGMTLSATAAVAGGDTVRASTLVDSIRSIGRRSFYGRDQVMHHFIRGLLLVRAGKVTEALPEYRHAMHSPTFGYTRVNYELGRSLLSLGRVKEGIPVVRSAIHGGIEGSNLYVTRTELHELIAQLFAADNQRDSAAAHYAIVERAWRNADPPFRDRYERARSYALGQRR